MLSEIINGHLEVLYSQDVDRAQLDLSVGTLCLNISYSDEYFTFYELLNLKQGLKAFNYFGNCGKKYVGISHIQLLT